MQIAPLTENQKFEHLKKVVFNHYEALHRQWELSKDKEDEVEKIPTLYVSPGAGGASAAPAKSRAPCRLFARGACHYGDRCRFAHEHEHEQEDQRRATVCWDCGEPGHRRGYATCKNPGAGLAYPRGMMPVPNDGKRTRDTAMVAQQADDEQDARAKRSKQQDEIMDLIAKSYRE